MNKPYYTAIVFSVVLFIFSTFAAKSISAQTPNLRPLTTGQVIERELKGDEFHSYSLVLTAGQYLDLVVEQKGIDVIVALFDANGKKVTEVDSPNGTLGAEPLAVIVETAGTYRLEVRSLEKTAAAGRYEVKIKELRAATEKDKSRIAASVAANKALSEAFALYQQGTAESLRNAVKKYEESLPFFRVIEDRQGEATTLTNIGAVFSLLGEKQQALKFYSKSLPLFRAVGDKGGEATTLNNIGRVYSTLGEQEQALKYLNESLPLLRAVGNKRGEAGTLMNIGAVYFALGERQQALKYFNESLPLLRAVGDKVVEAETLINIGTVYSDLGKKQQALKFYSESLPLFRAVGDKGGEATTLGNIGLVYSALGEKQQALKFYDEALPLHRAVGDKSGEATTLNNIGGVYSDLGEQDKALKFYNEALPLRRAVGDKKGEANTLDNLFYSLASGNPRFGIFYGKQSVNNYQILRSNVQGLDKNIQQTFLKSVEHTYRRLVDKLLEQKRYAEAQQVLNNFKDQQFFDFSQNKYFSPLAATRRETELTAGLNGKLETIVAAIRAADDFRRGIGGRKLTVAESAKLKTLENAQAAANADYLAFLESARKQFAAPPDEKDETPAVADLQAMQTILRQMSAQTNSPTVAVYTLVGTDNYRALVVTSDSIFSVSTPIKGELLNQKAQQLWKVLQTPQYDPQPLAKEIYNAVFAPLAAKLPADTKTIMWSLDGSLRYLPMAVLHDGKKYLVERYNNVVFTRADGERLTRNVSTNLTGTGFATSLRYNVQLDDKIFKLPDLSSVTTEMERIFKYKNSPTGILPGEVLLDKEFTRAAMISTLQKRRPLVHIASHFIFKPGDEAKSFLLLGDGSPFTLDEMKQQKNLFAGVELLTLSACDTAAQQEDSNGREIDGFAELAQRLGAGAVMASLWSVEDNSTAALMARFYKTYSGKNGSNKADALRTAQLALLRGEYKTTEATTRRTARNDSETADRIKLDTTNLKPFKRIPNSRFAHPFYWSPFILIGNWK